MGIPKQENMPQNGRIELKYRINHFQYLKIRNAICAHMKKDRYTLFSSGRGYLVRSLYYDTYDNQAYYEKMDGLCDRVKLRLRSYVDTPDENGLVRVELKVRKGNIVQKHSAFTGIDKYRYFMKYRRWPETTDPVLGEFERCVHVKELRPKVLVEYDREGYESRVKDGIRLTFDHKVRSAHATELFPEYCFLKATHYHAIVMEIKFSGVLPSWLVTLTRNYGLKVVANSKFTQGISVSRHDLHHPDGIVTVR